MTQRRSGVRLLHTSDWHIGRRFHQVELLDDQRRFGDWLVEVVRQEAIDAVLVAGDLYDRATPSAAAVDLLDDLLGRLLDLGTSVIAISGNHDSAERLNFGSRAMRSAGLHLCTERRSLAAVGEPITITGATGDSVDIVPVPYLDPHRLLDTDGADRTHDAVLRAVIEGRIATLRDPGQAIAMAHTFVVGGDTTNSERQLAVGGSSATGLDMFTGFGYVALGHLHRPQGFLDDRVVYSGSPLPYSFSEEHPKSVRILECGTSIISSTLAVDQVRGVRTVSGTLRELLESPTFDDVGDAWVRAELTDATVQLGVVERLRARFPNVLEVGQQSLRRQAPAAAGAPGSQRQPTEIIDDYLAETFDDLDGDDLQLVHGAMNAVTRGSE